MTAALVLLFGAMAAFRVFVIGDSKGLVVGKKIGVVNIEGMILDATRVVGWIKELREDKEVKAVLVRINSPGGSVGSSQELYRAIRRLSETKPTAASMGDAAASGGYYAACAARVVYANSGTVTGSIGVKMQLAQFKDLLAKLGVSAESIASGKFKDAGAPFKELTPEERAYLNSVVTDLYEQFVDDVAKARNLPVDKVKNLADGRIYTGRQAKAEGLVDEIGGREDAVEALKKLAELSGDVPLIEGPRKETHFLKDLLESALSVEPDSALLGSVRRFLY